MLNKTVYRAGSAALSLILAACAYQQPAPVIVGNPAGQTTTAPVSNPYGAPAYNHTETQVQETPYTPPVQTTQTVAVPTTQTVVQATSSTYIPSYAPVDVNALSHTVVRGDTVYNISKRYRISQDDLRAWNGLSADNTISVGQVLRVKPQGYTAAATSKPVVVSTPVQTEVKPVAAVQPTVQPTVKTTPTVAAKPATTAVQPVASVPATSRTVSGITWQRPTAGSIINNFGGSSKGVDIAGTAGQAVVAAADGKVVYAGSALRGYGNLVIIQHNSNFLTAYGHNQSILVNENQMVKRGQTIARMGNSDASRTQLHFEVRQNGKPVDPKTYVAF